MCGPVGLAATPMQITTSAATSETATIFRWVSRSAVRMLVLFMTHLPKRSGGYLLFSAGCSNLMDVPASAM